MQNEVKKNYVVPLGEKIGYSLGDAAANFVFMAMIIFQSDFYVNVFGLSTTAAGSLLLIGRLWDAFFDPVIGILADRTNTRWGKFRPWILWTAFPWGIIMVLAYTTPDFSYNWKFVWALATNILLMSLYSANNTPYSAMAGVMTGDVNERTTLSSFRFGSAMIAQMVVSGFTPALVDKFGKGAGSSVAHGWEVTMTIWAIVCVICFLITFAVSRERIKPNPEQKASLKEDFGFLLKNGPWIAMFVLTLAHFTVLAMRGGTVSFYFDYYVDRAKLYEFLSSLGLVEVEGKTGILYYLANDIFNLLVKTDKSNVAKVGFSFFNMSAQFVQIIGVVFSTFLVIKFGKRKVALVCFIVTTILMAAFIFLPKDAIASIYLLEYIRVLTYSPTIPLLWAMFADVADYGEWKSFRRTTGIIFATIIFALKAGLALGASVQLWILGAYGYKSLANFPEGIKEMPLDVQLSHGYKLVEGTELIVQTPEAINGINMIVSVYSAAFFVVVIICLAKYQITKEMNLQIQDDLAERRKAYN